MTKVIRTEDQYEDALERVYVLLQDRPVPESSSGEEVDLLATLIDAYEAVHYPMVASDSIDYLRHKMQQLGLKQTDLIPFIGGKSLVSKILNHKRDLTLPMIKRLSKGLHIPVERLIGL